MKNKFLLIVALSSTFSHVHAADPIKIGYVNLEYVMNMLPDSKNVEKDLKTFESQLSTQLKNRATTFQEKLQTFQKEHPKMIDDEKEKKEKELQSLHAEIEQLQLEAQNLLANKQMELLKPLYEKVQKAIETFAKKNKYTHVLNANTGGISFVLYGEKQYDLSDFILKEMGINPEAKADKKVPSKTVNSKDKADNKKSTPAEKK
jgi:outer membrane protein